MISVHCHLNNWQTNRQIMLIFHFTYLIATSLKKIKVCIGVSLCYLSRLKKYMVECHAQYGRILYELVFYRKPTFTGRVKYDSSIQYGRLQGLRVIIVWYLDLQPPV